MFQFKNLQQQPIQTTSDTIIYIVGQTLGELSDNQWIQQVIGYSDFKYEPEKILSCYAPQGLSAHQLILASIGDQQDQRKNENTGGLIADKIFRGFKDPVSLFFDSKISQQTILDILFGIALKMYQFDQYKTTLTDDEKAFSNQIAVFSDIPNLSEEFQKISAIIKGVFLARDLVSEPANILNPVTYAQRCQKLEEYGLKVSVLGEKEMEDLGMHCLLGVGKGSPIDSKLVIMEWYGDKSSKDMPLAFVGKGVCFDTGGISLKPAANMWDMVFDMGGSAAVVGAMTSLALRKAKYNVVGIIGLVENMPDGCAMRPGDVVKTANGKTVEVLNTDAEGRLVLADALWYVQDKFKSKTIIDLATLTGAIIVSLGYDYAGVFGNNQELIEALKVVSHETGEKIWSMPLDASMKKRLKSRVADLANIASSPEGGSSTAAAFLEEFINEGVVWAHLDIAGTAWTKEAKPICPKGATGWGVRLLNAYVEQLEKRDM